MRKKRLNSFIAVAVFAAILCFYWMFVRGVRSPQSTRGSRFSDHLLSPINEMSKAIMDNRSLLNHLKEHMAQLKKTKLHHKPMVPPVSAVKQPKTESTHIKVPKTKSPQAELPKTKSPPENHVEATQKNLIIPVLVMACNRPSVSRSLDLLIKYKAAFKSDQFPLFVSQDGNHQETMNVIKDYGDKLTYMQHTMLETISPKHFNLKGYYKLAAHYKWALNQVFSKVPTADAVIIVEDDLEISPDFFSYFQALHPLLKDPSLMCISAWNDNGKTNSIDATNGQTSLYRSDFFPGLGWMLSKDFWLELEPKWPAAFWDDWLREPDQRKDRSCIRPEISRTKTFGRVGVSNGQFYDKHLKFIKLNDIDVDWSKVDISYLHKDKYDKQFAEKIELLSSVSLSDLQTISPAETKEVKVLYSSAASFKMIAKTLDIMDDFKSGVPRTAYRGVVTTLFKGVRVYVAPDQNWTGYNPKWS
uniref:Alpha-1,3-mannosyl-glycoprotein 2-beta-N-acetylglucosaminyltransferase n=1 Tax=Phallusia mammillata TaxID=59560 RepID=A0A6F9DK14_9ASCI|nr:alpha-1,3-mannosyl-glycoprotein 2-beta-N-acetylglucosaminyltransferase-like [Phallusia mammillata]